MIHAHVGAEKSTNTVMGGIKVETMKSYALREAVKDLLVWLLADFAH